MKTDVFDVFIVGGGPAGLAAAIAARLKGFDVAVADAAQPPIDKACGEGLMPDSLDALRRLGVTLDPEQSFAFRGIRFIGDGGTVAADFPRDCGIAVRRIRLHQALIDRAQEVGVKLLWRTRVTGIDDIRARWIVGADGARFPRPAVGGSGCQCAANRAAMDSGGTIASAPGPISWRFIGVPAARCM